jgi:polyisoprenoid-binding protein YceI
MAELAVWQIDPAHTVVEFAVRHLMISTVKGRFRDVQGTAQFDPADLTTGTAEVTIQVASIDTGVADRDRHLRSADFFDVENYPTMTWRARKVERTGENRYRVAGDLTIRGVTREIPLEVAVLGTVKDPWGSERLGLSASGSLRRSDFGLTWNQVLETGGVVVGDEVKVTLEVELVREVARAAA